MSGWQNMDENGHPDDDQDGTDLQFATGLEAAVTRAYGRGELGIVIDEGALDLLQQTLLVLGERHVDLQVRSATSHRRQSARGDLEDTSRLQGAKGESSPTHPTGQEISP